MTCISNRILWLLFVIKSQTCQTFGYNPSEMYLKWYTSIIWWKWLYILTKYTSDFTGSWRQSWPLNDRLLNQGHSSPFYFPIGSLASFDSRHKHYSRTEIDAFSRRFSNRHDVAIIDVIKRRKLSKFMMKRNAVYFEAIVNALVDLKSG